MPKLTLIHEVFREPPALDTAVSHAILDGVASGRMGATMRLHVPPQVLAFGRADRAAEGYRWAVRAAEAHGYAAVERLAGGRAAVFHDQTLAFAWATPDPEPRRGIHERFELIAEVMERSFRRLGLDARVGELPGEYCPGRYSVNIGGRVKVMGVGQRLVRGAAHVGGVVVVDGADRIRDVLVPVYRALRLDWDPRVTGALADGAPGIGTDVVTTAITTELEALFAVEPATLSDETVDAARGLVEGHLPSFQGLRTIA